jgi:hypothetical protein
VVSLVLVALGLSGLILAAADTPREQDRPRSHLAIDFRDGLGRLPSFQLIGPEAEAVVKTDARGLRITLPAGRADGNQVGVEFPLRLHGNFEIALGYELLTIGDPPPERGAGVMLRLEFDSPSPHAVQVTRLRKPPGGGDEPRFALVAPRGETFGAVQINQAADGKEHLDAMNFRAGEPAGRLKLVRTGPQLEYWATEGAPEFHRLRSKMIGTPDVQTIRLVCTSGYDHAAVDVRFTDLVLDADRLPAQAESAPPARAQSAPPAPAARRPPYLALGVLAGGLLTAAALLLVYLLGKRRAARSPAGDGPAERPAAAPPRPAHAIPERTWLGYPLGTSAALGLGVVVWFAQAGGGPPPETAPVREFEQSFKGGTDIPRGFELSGPLADQDVKVEPAGLRITLPPGSNGNGQGTGLSSTFGVKGDFEITVAFEILQETPPAPPTPGGPDRQTRFTLGATLDREGFNMTTFSRRVHANADTQFLAWVTLWDEAAGKNRQKAKGFPTTAMTGRIRLARTGAILSYSAAEGPVGEFVVLQQYPFGAEDLKHVGLVGATDDAQGSLDVRVTDFHVRAEALPNLPAAAPAKAGGEGWLMAAALLGLATALPLLAALGVRLYAGRSRGAGAGSAPSGQAKPAAAGRPLAVPCTGCGKTLKVRAGLAGKRVKCPGCGGAVLVPSLQPAEPGRTPP